MTLRVNRVMEFMVQVMLNRSRKVGRVHTARKTAKRTSGSVIKFKRPFIRLFVR